MGEAVNQAALPDPKLLDEFGHPLSIEAMAARKAAAAPSPETIAKLQREAMIRHGRARLRVGGKLPYQWQKPPSDEEPPVAVPVVRNQPRKRRRRRR